MVYKGSVPTFDDLELIVDKQNGDFYNVIDTGNNYVWDEALEQWDEVGSAVDISGKLDKVTTVTPYDQLYFKAKNGVDQLTINVTPSIASNAVPQRTTSGAIKGATATANDELVPKLQMDTALAGKQNSLGFTPENVANKAQFVNFSTPSENKYPSELAVVEYVSEMLGDIETLLEAL